MKTSNIQTSHNQAIIRGWVDGTGLTTDSGSSAGGSGITESENGAGLALAAGDVVVLASDGTVQLTTTAQDTRPVGVVLDDIDDGEFGPIAWSGPVDLINVTASVTAGHWAETSTTAGDAQSNTTRRTGSFGYFTSSGTTPSGFLTGSGADAGDGTVIGTVTPDGTIVTISSGTSHRAFPGVAWLTGTHPHLVGDKFLLVYREGTSHLAGGDVKGMIGTVSDTDPWTFTYGSAFTIENVANDLRCEDAVSVINVGGTATAVIAAREYNGSVNLSPHILVCDDPAATMTSSSTWTRHSGPTWNGTTENLTSGYVMRLANGNYLVGLIKLSAGTFSAGVAIVTDPEDWSSPTFVTIGAGYTEVSISRLADDSLRAHLRNTASNAHHVSVSTDNGATWSAPASLFTADGFPMFRELVSGIMLTVYRSDAAAQDTAYRQSATAGSTWTTEVILDATGNDNAYATLLQLDDNHVLVIYAIENNGTSSTDSDIYSQIFVDSSVFAEDAVAALDDLTDVTLTSPQVDDTLRFDGAAWVNDNRRWEPVTFNFGSGPELVWDGDDLVMEWKGY